MITYMETDPSKIHVMNNYALVEFLDDDVVKLSKIIKTIKQNTSSKLRSIYVGRCIDRPDFIYGDESQETQIPLECIKKNESIIAYNPMSIQVENTWKDKKYHLIRAEDIYCVIENWKGDK